MEKLVIINKRSENFQKIGFFYFMAEVWPKNDKKNPNNKIMTSKVDRGQNKTIKVTQCSFLIRLPNVTSNWFFF